MTSPTANAILGITDLFCTWQRSDGTTQSIVLPKPNDFVYDPKAKMLDQTERSKLGVNVLVGRILDETLPEFELTWASKTLSLLAMQYGYAFGVPGTTPVAAVITRMAITAATYAASTSGYEGYGVLKDAESTGSYEDPVNPGVNVQLTQQPFDTFNSSSPHTFAIFQAS